MESYEVVYRATAADDLSDIYRWVHEASADPVTAERFVARLMAFCDKIGGMAHAGRPRDDLLAGLRTFPFEKRAVIAYRVENGRVEITNIFLGGRDYETLYRDERGE